MKYNKPFISFYDQVQALKSKGLDIGNEQESEACLSNISYYRLRAYTYPFQDNADANHPFD